VEGKKLLGLLTIVIILIGGGCDKYSSGKDTVKSFGDGSLQLENYVLIKNGVKQTLIELYDLKVDKSIEKNVTKFKEENGKLYLLGDSGYTIVDIKTHEVKQNSKKSFFNNEEQKQFDGL